jgi:signal transduction histidine kinase
MAQGNLDTRVGPSLGSRRDEIALLGRDFDHMAERIESLVDGHKRLLGDVSHELRSPLARLIVALGLAKQAPKEAAGEHLNRIAVEARRLDNLIGQLLTLSRIDSGSSTDAATTLDLVNLVHEVANDADFEARAQGRNVVVAAADPCNVTGSVELLRSAIENIVRNAVRFTRKATAVEITLRRTGSKILLRVRDHGPGVPDAMLSEIFLPFRRVTAPETPSDGAGLGLAIAQRAIGLHRGTVHATNAPDGGLIVEIELPAV